MLKSEESSRKDARCQGQLKCSEAHTTLHEAAIGEQMELFS